MQIVEERLMENKGKKKAVQGTIYHLTKQYYSGLWMIMIFLMKNPENSRRKWEKSKLITCKMVMD